MNSNTRIARELVRIAKELTAANAQYEYSASIFQKSGMTAVFMYIPGDSVYSNTKEEFFNAVNECEKNLDDKIDKLSMDAAADGFQLTKKESKFWIGKSGKLIITDYLDTTPSATEEQMEAWLKKAGITEIF